MKIDNVPINSKTAKLLKEKLFASWGSVRDQFDTPNNHSLSRILYKSLYAPTTIADNEITERIGFDRKAILTQDIKSPQKNIPSVEEFTLVVVRALTSDIDYSKNLYPDAIPTIEQMAQYGPIRIWTKGDVYGINGQPGSAEQIKKVATAGLGKLRNRIALQSGKNRKDILTLKAAEDKLPFIKEILREFKNQKIEIAILLDNNIDNIINAIEESKYIQNIRIYPIWLHDKNEDTFEHKKIKNIKQVTKIKDVLPAINTILQHNNVGFIVDFDGVLVDDKKRIKAQFETVYNKLKEKKWL